MARSGKSSKRGGRQWWRESSGPAVSFMRFGDRVIVDFLYRPERVAGIKKVPGARYNPDDKSWTVPFEELQTLQVRPEFSTIGTLNGIGEPAIEVMDVQRALQNLRAGPFSVAESIIASVPLEVVIRFNARFKRLCIVPRIGSSAYRILQRLQAALFSSWDNGYVLPVGALSDFLKRCRDKEILFAVDEAAGGILRDSAEARKQVVSEPTSASADDLLGALCTPFISMVYEENLAFKPNYFTREQFKLAFPGYRAQGGKPAVLDERGMLRFVGRIDSLPFPVWLTKEVHSFVGDKRRQFSDELNSGATLVDDVAADLVEASCLWKTVESGRGALVINLPLSSDFRDILLGGVAEVTGDTYSDKGETVILEIPDSKLLLVAQGVEHLCDVHGVSAFPTSRSFQSLLEDVKLRTKELEKTRFYTSMEDVSPDELVGLAPEEASRLFPHQRVAVSWLQQTPFGFLGDDMGLGKTLSVLTYFSALMKTNAYEVLLVVCPNSLTRNWAREVAMWFPKLEATVLAGDKASKAWALRLLSSGSMSCNVLVLNYEAIRLDYVTPEIERLAEAKKTLLCLDESQRIKNPTGKTFKAISQIAPRCERRVLLSGTPTPKDVSDLWAQMRIIDGGQRLGKSYYKWLSRVAELGTEYSKYAVKKFHEDEVKESITRAHEIMLRRRKERVVNLPPKTFSLREIELAGAQLDRYNEIREGLMLRMRSISGEQFVREITNILEEYLRAVQVASNPRLVDPEWKGEPAKFLELDELVNEIVKEQGQKMVIWSNYLGNIRELCERYKEFHAAPFSGEVSASEREQTVRAFQEESSPSILVAVPAAGGVGITLTAAQTAVYVDKTWNAEHWMQSVDRIHRIGQTGTVNVISLISCKVDEIIHWNLRRKERGQAQTLGDYDAEDSKVFSTGVSREELLEALEV